jgi:hypothetical protein
MADVKESADSKDLEIGPRALDAESETKGPAQEKSKEQDLDPVPDSTVHSRGGTLEVCFQQAPFFTVVDVENNFLTSTLEIHFPTVSNQFWIYPAMFLGGHRCYISAFSI